MTWYWRLDDDNLPALAADPTWIAFARRVAAAFPEAGGDPLRSAYVIVGDRMDSLFVTWDSEHAAFPNFRRNMGGGIPHEVFEVIVRVARRPYEDRMN